MNIFKLFNKGMYWDVTYRNSKGIIKVARLKAQDEIELLYSMKRTFAYADVLHFMRV